MLIGASGLYLGDLLFIGLSGLVLLSLVALIVLLFKLRGQ